jgi:hypothetical protein
MTWQFTAQIDEDGDLSLEWYRGKGNIVTICLSAENRRGEHGCPLQANGS